MDPELMVVSALAVILVISGLAKLPRGARFGEILQTTYGFRDADARRLQTVVPLAELTCAILLIAPPVRGLGFLATAALLLAAIYVTSTSYLAGRGGDCGCFGDLYHQRLGRGTIGRLLLMFTALLLAFGLRLSQGDFHLTVPPGVVVGLAAGALLLGVSSLASGIRTFHAIHHSADEY